MAAKRQPVAKGGLWSTQAAPVSRETQNLLKGKLRNVRDINLCEFAVFWYYF
jgi:hypothetical protein